MINNFLSSDMLIIVIYLYFIVLTQRIHLKLRLKTSVFTGIHLEFEWVIRLRRSASFIKFNSFVNHSNLGVIRI
jgi:hypothetical protein